MLSLLDDEAADEAVAFEAAVEEGAEVTEAVVVVDSASCCWPEVKLAVAKSAATDNSAAAAASWPASEDLRLHEVEYGEALASRLARRFALRSSMIRRNCSIFSRVTWI